MHSADSREQIIEVNFTIWEVKKNSQNGGLECGQLQISKKEKYWEVRKRSVWGGHFPREGGRYGPHKGEMTGHYATRRRVRFSPLTLRI
jgi:hypothetical protein